MSTSFTAKAYYIFMFVLPLLFYTGITDKTLLPRQLLLSVFVLLLAGFVWKGIPRHGFSVKVDAAGLTMATYLLVSAVISFLNATVLSEALYAVSKLWIVVSFSLLTVQLLRNNVIAVRHIINAGIVFGCTALATALVDMTEKTLRGENLLHWVYTISGGFGNKNLLSSALFLCLPFFMLGLHGKRRLKIISSVALVLVLFFVVVLRTRIALIATIFFFGIVALFYLKGYLKHRFWLFAGTFFTLATVGLLALYGVFGNLDASADARKYFSRLLNTDTLNERLLFWRNSLDMFREYPLGVGPGNWQIYFPKYGLGQFNSFRIANGTETLQRPHNDFLASLCETGILGFAVYLSIFGVLIYMSLKSIRAAGNAYDRRLSIYLFAGIIGFILIAFFDFPMERIEHQVMFFLLSALVIHQYGVTFRNGFAVPVKRIVLLLFVALGACYSFFIAYKRFDGEKYAYKIYLAREGNYDQEVLSYVAHAESPFYEIDTRTIPLEWYRGVAKFSIQQYAESEACFEKAYDLTPYNIHAINNLASCYEVNGKRNNAISTYLKALQISPRFEEARLNLAAVYFNNKEYDKAFQTIDSCSVESRDLKYKTFLPPILKAKVRLMMNDIRSGVSPEAKSALLKMQDYLQLYYESKKNNITFERQIIKHLNRKS